MSQSFGEVLRSVKSSPPCDQVDDDRDRQRRGQPVPPHDAVAEAPRHREDEEAQEQHEGDVDRPQRLRRHDRVGGVQVEGRHHERDEARRSRRARPASLLAAPSSSSIVLLGALQRLVADRGRLMQPCDSSLIAPPRS